MTSSSPTPETPKGDSPAPEDLHADPANWKWGIFYFSPQDPRIIVPKRIRGLGWTINFARPSVLLWIAFLWAFIYGTMTLARLAGANDETRLTIKLLLAFGIIAFCYRAAGTCGKTDLRGGRKIKTIVYE